MCCVAAVYGLVLCCARNQTVKNNYGTMADTTITSIIFVGFRYVTKGFVRLGYVRFSSVRLRLVSFGLVLFSFGFVIRRQSIMKPNL